MPPLRLWSIWFESAELILLAIKTKRVVYTRHQLDHPSFRLKGKEIRLYTALKYFGLWFDGKRNFQGAYQADSRKSWEDRREYKSAHVESREPNKDKLLANVAMLVLSYGALISADAVNIKKYRRTKMVLVEQKAVLRCVSAYCTVSIEAVSVLAGTPLDSHGWVQEGIQCYTSY